MMSSMTVGKKLMFSVSALFLLIGILSCVMFSGFNALKKNLDEVDKRIALTHLADQYESEILSMRAALRGSLLYTLAKKPEMVTAAKSSWAQSLNQASASLTEMQSRTATEETHQQISQAGEALAQLDSLYKESSRKVDSGDMDGALELAAGKFTASFNKSVDLSHEMVSREQKLLEQDKQAASDRELTSRWIAIVVILVSLGVGVGILLLVQSITRNLQRMTEALASGSEQVASAATQISSSSQQLAQGASEQAASLEETSASTEEINSMTSRNADNSKSVAELMASTTHRIANGNRKLAEMVVSMQNINSSSDKISKIIKTIDEIAFQTNMLALNAAVEAARAGEAGMGFAVVADEVRNLAQRCAKAAQDTATLIEESISSSHEGSAKLSEVAEAIGSITQEVEKVSTLVEEVSLGSQEQSKGLNQIAKAISQMEEVTQRTAAVAEESASAGEELNAQSQALQELAHQLTTFVGSSSQNAMSKLSLQATMGNPRRALKPQSSLTTSRIKVPRIPKLRPALGESLEDAAFQEF